MEKSWEFYAFLVTFISTIVSAFVSLLISFLSRRKLSVFAKKYDTNFYTNILFEPQDIINLFMSDTPFLTKPSPDVESYVIVDLIITNESPKPITVQLLSFVDENKEKIHILDWFNLQLKNSNKNISDQVTLTTDPLSQNSNGNIYFTSVDLYNDNSFVVPPHESKLFTHAIDSRHNNVSVTAFTTQKRFILSTWIIRCVNIVKRKIGKSEIEPDFKIYSTKISLKTQ